MAAGDFIHKQLISAASKDALSSMGIGAGIGAGVGAANSLITGNDTLLGGATSGAMMGAGAGAAYRYAGAKYGSGLMAAAAKGEKTSDFRTTFFTRATKDDFNMGFMGSADDAGHMKGFMDAANASSGKAAAAGSNMPKAGPIQTSTPENNVVQGPVGTTPQRVKAQQDAKAAITGNGSRESLKHAEAQSTWNAKRDAMNASRGDREKAAMAAGMAKDEQEAANLANFKNKMAKDAEMKQKVKAYNADKATTAMLKKGIPGADAKPFYRPGQNQLEMFASKDFGKKPASMSTPTQQSTMDFSTQGSLDLTGGMSQGSLF
jgi:hypothetical protein